MNKLSILFLLLAPLIWSCSSEQSSSSNANTFVSGTITNAGNKVYYLEELNTSAVKKLDSIKLETTGEFNFGVDVNEQGFYRLRSANDNFIVLILDKGEQVKINADGGNLEGSYTVEGSPNSESLKSLNKVEYGFYLKMDSLKREIMKHQQTRNVNEYVNAMNVQKKILDSRSAYIREFINKNPGSLAALAAVERLDKDQDLNYYQMVADELKKSIPNSQYYKGLKTRLDQWGKLAVGAEAPEIVMKSPNGESIALSSLQGKYVLIDFWASWCKPCRAENPNVVRLYKKYADQGFEVFSVSLDKNHNAWTTAIERDGLLWENHVSDLKYWQSAAVNLYDIKGIPLTYLIDKEGKIIAKNLRGKELETKLAEILGS